MSEELEQQLQECMISKTEETGKEKRKKQSPKVTKAEVSPKQANGVDHDKEVLLGTFCNMVNAGCDPLRYRTALCEFVSVSKCQYKNCFFHHIDEHLSKRTVSENAKEATQLVMYLLNQRVGLKKQVLDHNIEELNLDNTTNVPIGRESVLMKEYNALQEQYLEVESNNRRLEMENQVLRQLLLRGGAQPSMNHQHSRAGYLSPKQQSNIAYNYSGYQTTQPLENNSNGNSFGDRTLKHHQAEQIPKEQYQSVVLSQLADDQLMESKISHSNPTKQCIPSIHDTWSNGTGTDWIWSNN